MQNYINTLPSSTSWYTVVHIYNNTAKSHIPVQIAFILTQLPNNLPAISYVLPQSHTTLPPSPPKFQINSTYYTMQNGKKLYSIAVQFKYLPCFKSFWTLSQALYAAGHLSSSPKSPPQTNDSTLFLPVPHRGFCLLPSLFSLHNPHYHGACLLLSAFTFSPTLLTFRLSVSYYTTSAG